MPYKHDNKEIWGIDIGSTCLRAVKLARIKEGVRLVDYDIRELSYQGRDEEKTLEAIRKALVGLAGRKSLIGAKVVISVPGALCFQRLVKIPPCPVSKIPEIMSYEAKQQIPFDLNEVIWDYQLLSAPEDVSEGRKVALFAVKKQVIDPIMRFCREALMKVIGIQMTHIAILNFLMRERTDDEPFAVLDLGGRHTEFFVVDPESAGEFAMRPLNVSGVSMTETIAERQRLSFIEAEQAKILAMSGQGEFPDSLEPVVANVASEITRSLGFFKSQFLKKEVSRIFLTGRGLGFETGMDALRSRIGKPVKIIESPNRFAFTLVGPAEVFFADCRQLGVAFGLALQGLGEVFYTIDLLPKAVRIDNVLADKRVTVAGALAILWVALIVSWFYMGSQLSAAKNKASALNVVVNSVDKASKDFADITAGIPPLLLKTKNIASYGQGRLVPLKVLNHIYASLDEVNGDSPKVWVSSISMRDATEQGLRDWAATLGSNPIYSSIESIILRKGDYVAGDPEGDRIFGTLEPCRISKLYTGSLMGEALIGEELNIYWAEAIREKLTAKDSPIASAELNTGWKETLKELPDGRVLGVIEFEIDFRFFIPALDSEWGRQEPDEPLVGGGE
ncbi:MAG: hypothetical protein Kow00107_04160 [Planctomycetota bacterium]